MLRRWVIQERLGLIVGVGLTVAAMIAHGLGWTERAELQLYDALVRRASTVPASDRILHIDIDDDALERYQSWPWPRDTQGELLRILHELGAERTVVDLVWSERKSAEVRIPSLDTYADLEGEIKQVGELSPENFVDPDQELADAVRNAGPVYLSFYYEQPGEAASPAPERTPASQKPALTITPTSQALTITPGSQKPGLTMAPALRMAGLLREDLGLTAAQLAEKLGEPLGSIEAHLASVKRSVARERVAKCLQADPLLSARQVHASLLRTPFDRPTADRADVLAAYDRELGLRNLRRLCPPVPPALKGKLPVVPEVAPPLFKVTSGTPRVGFVNFDAQADADGSLRRMPLMVEWEGRLLEQLAFAAARDALGIRIEDLSMDASGALVIAAGANRPGLRVQLDERDRTLVNWHARTAGWNTCFTHLPVTRLLQIFDIRQAIRNNERLKGVRLGEAMRLVKDEASFAAYREQIGRLLESRRALRAAIQRGEADTSKIKAAREQVDRLRQQVDRLSQAVKADHEMTTGLIRQTWADLQKEPNPSEPAIAGEYRRFQQAHVILDEIIPGIDATNTDLASREVGLMSQLRDTVAGKTCFLGYTASALADMVTAPPYGRMPGVLIHSQLYNSFLQGRFRTWSRRASQSALILLLGLAVTAVSTLRSPRDSFLFVAAAIGLALIANAVGLFGRWDHWLPLFTGLALTFVAWAMIVMLRYLVTDRQRRRFSKAVAQYVSPAMARQIAESGRELSFSPRDAVVSCLFSDIAGFTTMSEELGPAGTRAVLNPYLEAMSAVLHRHQAVINKFMGDGVFAFFNPPILPWPDHEVAACEAALDSSAALAQLVARHGGTPLAPYFRRLSIRIGIASGPVFVGDYGSPDKLDYTCVGDVVNLAARLESANKQFGTGIMVSGPTRTAAGERYLYRHLGLLQVKGKTHGVAVYELLGRRSEVEGEILAYAERFDRAVLAFSRRDWPGAASGFEECLRRRPDDVAARRYLPVIRRYESEAPPPGWVGAFELTEK